MTMTPERQAEIDAAVAEATAGPWKSGLEGEPDCGIFTDEPLHICIIAETVEPEDAAAIVILHNNWPDASATITELREEAERLREALARIAYARPAGDIDSAKGTRKLVKHMEGIAVAALSGAK